MTGAGDAEGEAVAAVLREIVDRGEMSIAGLARYLGMSRSQVSRVIGGQRRPGLALLRAASRRLPEARLCLRETIGYPQADGERTTLARG